MVLVQPAWRGVRMKMTVITTEKGDIVGFTHGPAHGMLPGWTGKKPEGGLVAGPGQRSKEIEVPDELAAITDGAKLHELVKKHLK